MKSLGSRIRGASGRFLWRHWAACLVAVLALLALITLSRMWQVGLIGAISLLPQLGVLLVLIVAVLVARQLLSRFTGRGLAKSVAGVQSQAAKEAVQGGVERGQAVLRSTVAGAKDALAGLGAEVKERLPAGQPAPGSALPELAPRCPSCSHYVRTGARFCDHCGAALPVACPRCGRPLRPKARFCDHCGAPIGQA